VLFLCTGNMVRSAFAELYARHLGCPLPVGSAATVYRNRGLFRETELALAARGVNPAALRAFRPRHLDDVGPHVPAGTLVLGMTHAHLAALARWPAARGRALLLGALLGTDAEIADPVLDGADFEQTFATVARAVEALVERLREKK
jgi:protein-tyrosine-phosphatase